MRLQFFMTLLNVFQIHIKSFKYGYKDKHFSRMTSIIGGITDIQLEIWYFLLILLENNEI